MKLEPLSTLEKRNTMPWKMFDDGVKWAHYDVAVMFLIYG